VRDYVPYEKRVAREQTQRDTAAALASNQQQNAAASVHSLLRGLAGARTDVYLEVLRPLAGLRRTFPRGPVIKHPGLRGGPDFQIAEVVQAYCLRGAIIEPANPARETSEFVFDALVSPDGRVWRFSGSPEAPNTYQLLASSSERVEALSTADLQRVEAGLRRR
jgi:hypothetical protein